MLSKHKVGSLSTITTYVKLLTAAQARRVGTSFVSYFGLLWLFIEPAGLFLPEKLDWGWRGYVGLALLSLLCAIFSNVPERSVCASLSSPDSTIELKVGDLFDEPGHIVIGVNDVFDTELGDVIKPSSIQGQLLTRIYHSDHQRLEADINTAVGHLTIEAKKDLGKKKGKNVRYPIGTTIALGHSHKRYFLNAYGRMGNDLKVKSTADDVWNSLSCLWNELRLKGHGLEVAIPIIGSDLARTNLPRMALIKLIVISFIAASKEGFVTRKLTVVVHPKDLESVDFYSLKGFLVSTCF